MKARTNGPRTGVIRVIPYYRMSDPVQDKSIDRQNAEVNPHFTAKGYKLLREERDEGISGNELAKRVGLKKAVARCLAGEADGIVADDLDRVFRLDMFEMGELVAPLRRAGVFIESVAQGRYDFNTMDGRIVLGVTSEAKFGQIVDTGRRCLTQHLRMARDVGKPPLPKTPYGYRRIVDPDRPPRKDGKRDYKWEIDEQQAAIVRSIFDWYASGRSPGWISEELHRRCVPSPAGAAFWRRGTIREVLANRAYLGDRAWGKTGQGKFFRQKGGKVVPANGCREHEPRPVEEWIVGTNANPAIITDRNLWQTVQGRLERTKRRQVYNDHGELVRTEGEATTPLSSGESFLLSRLLVCGACGAWMTGFHRVRGVRLRAYKCSHYSAFGSRGCVRCEVPEAVAVTAIVAQLRCLLAPERQAFLREQLAARLQSLRSDDNRARLRKRMRTLEASLTKYRRRLLEVSTDMIPQVEEGIRECVAQIEATSAELASAEKADPVRDLQAAVDASAKAIWTLEKALDDGDRPALREALRGIIAKIIVHPAEYQTGTGKTRRRPGTYQVELFKGTGLELLADLDGSPRGTVQVCCIPSELSA